MRSGPPWRSRATSRELNAARTAAGEKTISIGIGLNSGEVVMGNMGSEDHMDYTVIGDNINIAARMCGIAQPGQVLASKSIADAIGEEATMLDMHPVMVKGKDQPIGVAEVVTVKGGARRYMRKSTDATATYRWKGSPMNPTPLPSRTSARPDVFWRSTRRWASAPN